MAQISTIILYYYSSAQITSTKHISIYNNKHTTVFKVSYLSHGFGYRKPTYLISESKGIALFYYAQILLIANYFLLN